MVTATQNPPKQELQVVPFKMPSITFEVSLEQIAELRKECMAMTITDVKDKAQVAAVQEKRTACRKLRTGIEKMGKSARDDANRWNKEVLAKEHTLTDPIVEIETHLQAELDKVKAEEERVAREAEEKRQAVTRQRLKLLQDCGKSYMESDVAGLSDEDFVSLLEAERKDKQARDEQAAKEKAEQDRIAEEQRLEREKLEREKAELARKNAEAEARTNRAQARSQLLVNLGHAHEMTFDQLADMDADQWENVLGSAKLAKQQRDDAAKAEQERLDAQKKEQELAQQRIDAELDRIYKARKSELMEISVPAQFGEPGVVVITRDTTEDEYQVVLAKAKEWKSQYDAHVAAEEKAAEEREAADAKAKAEAAEAELARLESLRPDHEKILAFITLFQSLEFPTLSPACKGITPRANDILNNTSEQLHELADELAPKSNAV